MTILESAKQSSEVISTREAIGGKGTRKAKARTPKSPPAVSKATVTRGR